MSVACCLQAGPGLRPLLSAGAARLHHQVRALRLRSPLPHASSAQQRTKWLATVGHALDAPVHGLLPARARRFSSVMVCYRNAAGQWCLALRVANIRKHQLLKPTVRMVLTVRACRSAGGRARAQPDSTAPGGATLRCKRAHIGSAACLPGPSQAVDSITPSNYLFETLAIDGLCAQVRLGGLAGSQLPHGLCRSVPRVRSSRPRAVRPDLAWPAASLDCCLDGAGDQPGAGLPRQRDARDRPVLAAVRRVAAGDGHAHDGGERAGQSGGRAAGSRAHTPQSLCACAWGALTAGDRPRARTEQPLVLPLRPQVLVFVDGIDAMTSKNMSARHAYNSNSVSRGLARPCRKRARRRPSEATARAVPHPRSHALARVAGSDSCFPPARPSQIRMNEAFAPLHLEVRGKALGLDFGAFDATVRALDLTWPPCRCSASAHACRGLASVEGASRGVSQAAGCSLEPVTSPWGSAVCGAGAGVARGPFGAQQRPRPGRPATGGNPEPHVAHASPGKRAWLEETGAAALAA
jgi:hypothetical protein